MLAKVISCAVIGLDGQTVGIEVDVSAGFPQFVMVGLPDKAVDEARQRVPAAIKNAGYEYPSSKRVVVNLAPADLKKEGAAYDVPIALGILIATGQLAPFEKRALYVGELALDGSVRRINGVLPMALWARSKNICDIYVPEANAKEASIVKGMRVYSVKTIRQLVEHLQNKHVLEMAAHEPIAPAVRANEQYDMRHINGQEQAKRALEVAAAGGHNISMVGPPGSGKTLLSRTIPTIMPAMSEEEALEVTKIHSVAGLLTSATPLVVDRPFRSPHHTTSSAALVGGGSYPRPGEISLAHRGVLFLDEFPEFPRKVLDSLRQPLEDGVVTVSRAQGTISFPARFILIAAQNPCPCGFADDNDRECICSPTQVLKYRNRVSGPIADRIDIHVHVPRVSFQKLTTSAINESSQRVQKRVEAARKRAYQRLSRYGVFTNGEMPASIIRQQCRLTNETRQLVQHAVDSMQLSARAFHRILKVARTIADLDESNEIAPTHIAEAIQYRPNV